ncbi:MAG: YkgJ family cysteine cluster protein [Gammaproteobacteria bacterium]|nr:YkgJ family cysteine cluster protein [Gammaproteobacteria bacterium]
MPIQTETSIASQEYQISYAELMDLSPHSALLNFHVRHDQRIEHITARSKQSKACFKGCAYCCFFKVIADAVEIFAMVDYVKENIDPQQLDQIIVSAKYNIEEARNLSHEEQSTINQQCPLLIDNTCVIYPVRSIKCRNFHATDVSTCHASYNNPKDLTILNNNIPEVYIAAMGSGDGFMAALHNHGYDDRTYDHNAAFIEALENTDCKQRYDAGRRAFKTAKYDND